MKPFRRSRDGNGRFALTTLQNPNLEIRSLAERVAAAARQVETSLVAAPDENSSPAAVAPRPFQALTPQEIDADLKLAQAFPYFQQMAALPHPPEIPAPKSESETASAKRPANSKPPGRSASPPRSKRAASRSRHGLASRAPVRERTPLERHARKCVICNHPRREDIEQDFLDWRSPGRISDDFNLSHERYIYRHAHALGLYARRRMNIRLAAERIVEDAEVVTCTADSVLRAIRACSLINDRGEWHDAPSHVIFSSGSHLNLAPQHAELPSPPPSSPALVSPDPRLQPDAAQNVRPATEVELLSSLEVSHRITDALSNRRHLRLETDPK
jgi:hypothetical protein